MKLWLVFLLVGAAAARGAETDEAAWSALAQGGAAIVIRHARTEPGVGDPPGYRLDDCATQRNLSQEGRAQSRRFGALLAGRGVRIDEVLSSRWCRCIDTARLAFPRHDVRVFEPLNSFFDDRGPAARQTADLRRYLADLAPPRNAVLVTHMVNIQALTGQAVSMGEALVVRSDGAGGVRVVGRLPVP